MKTAMTLPLRFWALLLTALFLYQFSTDAMGDWCKFEKDIELTLNVADSETLAIYAAAGDLEIVGIAGTDTAVIDGKVCASKESWVEESSLDTQGGANAKIRVNLPEANGGWSLTGNSYARMDLRIKVPQDLELEVKDSSGDMMLRNIASVDLQDSSGDIEIEDALGSVTLRDSSGDIDIEVAKGDVTIESDSSGDINASDIEGSVLVMKDSSGDIDVTHVGGHVVVERDSSGSISANDVGGDFRVLKDGSGDIRSNNIAGEVEVPDKG